MVPRAPWPEPDWLSGDGPESITVLSTRIRLARNLAEHPFTHRAEEPERGEILEEVREAARASRSLSTPRILRLDRTSTLDRQYLVERHLVSPDLANARGPRAVAVGKGETLSVMINEEDHLRIQGLLSGFQLRDAWNLVDKLDEELGGNLDLAFSPKWGYLTACPTNTGTGLRASVLIHLPGLVLTKQIGKVLRGISQVGLAVRGMFGEGTEVMGNFFQISNQTTLGLSENEVIESLGRVTRQVIDHEQSASEVLLKSAPHQIEDKVFRAYGILRHGRVISSQEVVSMTSALRFGFGLGFLRDRLDTHRLNRLMIETLPAHLQRANGTRLDQAERDYRRAAFVRSLLGEEPDAEA
ncbi:MAG: protein arginine kinase [Gemmatimonadetes bacterium]|nr:protein arginine kinase [Gemmatimonadota bacterium]